MSRLALTARTIPTLQPNGAKQRDYWDSSQPGFGIRVAPSRKTWVMMFRFNGRQRRLSLGTYPSVSLADARELARSALLRVASGHDPASEKIAARRAETFSELADEYLERHARRKKKSWRADEYLINKELIPRWKNSKIREISRADVRALLDTIADRGALIQANRVLALVRKMFNFGVERELMEVNPCHRIQPPGTERQRDRVLAEHEIRAVWQALESENLSIRALFRLRILTAQRGGELTSMRWQDIDLASGWWTIPAERAKNGLTHRVPLSPQVLTILSELQQAREEKRAKDVRRYGSTDAKARESSWVFPGPRRWTDDKKHQEVPPIRNVQKAIGRIRAASRVSFQGHDLRRTAASHMTSAGTSRLVVGKILNHIERDITRVYDRHSYDPEKRIALDAWGRRVEAMISEETTANVLTFARVSGE